MCTCLKFSVINVSQSCGVNRYFQCVPTFGLFAPTSKVTRVASSASARRGSGSVSRIPVGTSLMLSRERSGSQESLSSVGSVASNVSRSRLRLGVTSLAGQVGAGRHDSLCWCCLGIRICDFCILSSFSVLTIFGCTKDFMLF